jgi:ribosomal protein S18 acetylase RimI-like enzyme
VTDTAIELRRLLPEDAALYREIRLQGLADSPDAFSSTFESEQASSFDRFAERLANSAVFGAFRGALLLGVAGFYVEVGVKHSHKGVLWGMYVRPQGRRAGIGRRLVEAVIAHARRHVELLQLRVVSDNDAARRLYESLGFVQYGLERNAAKYQGRYHDDVLMALPLAVSLKTDATHPATEAKPA